MVKNNPPVVTSAMASMSSCWPRERRREESFCPPLCYPPNPLFSNPSAAPAFLPQPPDGEKTPARDLMPLAPRQVLLTPLSEGTEDRGGSASATSTSDRTMMTLASTSNTALGPPCQRGTRGRGLALFVLVFKKKKTKQESILWLNNRKSSRRKLMDHLFITLFPPPSREHLLVE